MPFIQINLIEGRSVEIKEELIERMTVLTAEVLNRPKTSVRIMINEVKPEHWGIAGETVRVRRLKERQNK